MDILITAAVITGTYVSLALIQTSIENNLYK